MGTATAGAAARGGVPGVVIRLAAREDVPGIVALIGRGNHRRGDAEKIRRCVLRAPSVVACRDGEVVGFVYARRFAPDVLEWCNVAVAPEYRRLGLGTAMVQKAEDEARRFGYVALVGANSRLHPGASAEHCHAARAFWERMGWREVLRTPDGMSVVIVKDLMAP